MNVNLIRAKEADISTIQVLAQKIWQSHYPAIVGQMQVDVMLAKLYNSAALQAQMQEGQQFFLVESDNIAVGFISISEKDIHELFLHKFYIDTEIHRKGIGSLAFAKLLELFPQITTTRLQVNRQNYKPINFYFKMGFVIDYVADFDIGDGYFMNDFVMVWRKL